MAILSPSLQEHEEEEEEEEEEEDAASYHPPAPSSEFFDTSTTVDPGYIISLIRKLLPPGVKTNDVSKGEDDCVQNTIAENICILDDNMNSEMGQEQEESFIGPKVSLLEDPWEECGCILWDLSADRTHAEFMVENLVLDVLLASLVVSKSMRIKEICLGIIANLACHEAPRKLITSMNRLTQIVTDQLFLDDTPCLSETCRLLTLCLQSHEGVTFAEALQDEHILSRILWISGNTLNSQLLEKCMELFLAILESQQDAAQRLLPSLINLGFPNLIVNLLASEMSNLTGDRGAERCSVLDSILCVIESISVTDKYSQVISSNKDIFKLILDMVKLPDKIEVASSCVTAVVLIANILTDEPDLVSGVSQDVTFLEGLLEILPLVSDDPQARAALWSVLARIMVRVEEILLVDSSSSVQQYAAVLMDKSDLILEDLEDHRAEDSTEADSKSNQSGTSINARAAFLAITATVLQKWIAARTRDPAKYVMHGDDMTDGEKVCQLMHYCQEHMA